MDSYQLGKDVQQILELLGSRKKGCGCGGICAAGRRCDDLYTR